MLKGSSDQNYYPMTVVIATLGGETLKRTIEHLNCSTVVASEILVCIPRQEAVRAKALKFSNVKVVETPCRGQVAQRAFGFKSASFEIVMQLDDDIEVQNNAVELLLETLKNNEPNVAVAPVLLEKQPSYAQVMNKTVRKLYYFLINGRDGYRMGSVSRAGAEIGYDSSFSDQAVHDVEWLPGGCVMHLRENLIKENFFPYAGKAFCEDLFHSHYLMKKGIGLKVDFRARCALMDDPPEISGIRQFIRNLSADYKARKYFVRISSRSFVRMHLYYICVIFNFLFKKLKSIQN